jgi:hypothetical protein
VVLDDTYNANPDSVRAGIDVLAATIGRKVLVLGDMGEIGEASGQYHDEIGGYAKSQGVDRLLAFGDASQQAVRNFGEGARHFCDIEKLIARGQQAAGPGNHGAGQGLALHEDGAGWRMPSSARKRTDASRIDPMARPGRAFLQRLQLHHAAHRAGGDDGAAALLRHRPAGNPLAGGKEDRAGGAQ